MRAFGERIYHVHVKDAVVRLNGRNGVLGSHLPFGDARRGWEFRSPGRGSIDFEEIIRALNEAKYAGPLSVEWEDPGMDREAGAREACQFVQNLDFSPAGASIDAAFSEALGGQDDWQARRMVDLRICCAHASIPLVGLLAVLALSAIADAAQPRASAVDANDIVKRRTAFEAEYRARLNELADACDKRQLPEEARQLRAWLPERHADTLTLFLLAPLNATPVKPPAEKGDDSADDWRGAGRHCASSRPSG